MFCGTKRIERHKYAPKDMGIKDLDGSHPRNKWCGGEQFEAAPLGSAEQTLCDLYIAK
jgi:hypothetical protein